MARIKTIRKQVLFPEDLVKEIEQIGKDELMDFSATLRQLVKEALRQRKKEQTKE